MIFLDGYTCLMPIVVSEDVQTGTDTLQASLSRTFLPPNSARIGYAAEGALLISALLSIDAVSALRKVWVLVKLWKQHSARKHETASAPGKKKEVPSPFKRCWFYLC